MAQRNYHTAFRDVIRAVGEAESPFVLYACLETLDPWILAEAKTILVDLENPVLEEGPDFVIPEEVPADLATLIKPIVKSPPKDGDPFGDIYFPESTLQDLE